jgi:hypothetical protein
MSLCILRQGKGAVHTVRNATNALKNNARLPALVASSYRLSPTSVPAIPATSTAFAV